MGDLATVDIKGVEILQTGTHNGRTFTTRDLDLMVQSFNALKGKLDPPLKLGHDDDQRLLQEDGYPAAGWIDAVKRVGGKLIANLAAVPQAIADLIEAQAYRKRSVEVYFDWQFEGRSYPIVLKGLALLGGDIPAVKTLDDIRSLYTDLGIAHDGAFLAMHEAEELAEWTTAFINTLPDSSFAYIRAGGTKDAEGKTTPRALRFLPYKDASGKVDLPHLRNALARLPQTSLRPDEQAKARGVLERAARSAGVGEYQEGEMDIAKLREALGLSAEADEAAVEAAIKDLAGKAAQVEELTAKVKDLETKLTEAASKKDDDADNADGGKGPTVEEMRDVQDKVGKLTQELAQRDATAEVANAIKAGKLLPKQEKWAEAYALKDLEGFRAYIAEQPVLVDLGVKGSASGGDGQFNLADYEPTDEERRVAEQMGTWSEDYRLQLIRQKAEAAGVKVPANFGAKEGDKD